MQGEAVTGPFKLRIPCYALPGYLYSAGGLRLRGHHHSDAVGASVRSQLVPAAVAACQGSPSQIHVHGSCLPHPTESILHHIAGIDISGMKDTFKFTWSKAVDTCDAEQTFSTDAKIGLMGVVIRSSLKSSEPVSH